MIGVAGRVQTNGGDGERKVLIVLGGEFRVDTAHLVNVEGKSMEDCSPLTRGLSFD